MLFFDVCRKKLTIFFIFCLIAMSPVLSGFTYAAEPSLLVQYHFEDSPGSVAHDSSGNSRDLTLFGGLDFVPGVSGNSLNLSDTSSKYAQMTSPDPALDFGIGDFTIGLWVKFHAFAHEQAVIEKLEGNGAPGKTGWFFTVYGPSSVRFGARLAPGDMTNFDFTGFSLASGVWHHLVIVRSGTSILFYVNGLQKDIKPVSGAILGATAYPLLLGKRNADAGQDLPLNGLMDEVAIYSRALSAAEIRSDYSMHWPCVSQSAGLVSWWGGDTNALDMVGTNNGILANGAAYAEGMVGQAFSFDGVDDYVSAPPSSNWAFGIGDFTIEFWTFGTSDDYKRPLINNRKTPDSENMWAIEIYGVANRVEFHSGRTIILEATNLLTSSSWNHIAVTRNNGLLSMYINGILSGSTPNANDFSEINDLQIGRDIMGGNQLLGRTFQGLMDEVAIFNRALSQAEIQAIYYAGSSGKCRACPSGMVSWWKGEGDALDSVGVNNGSLIGNATYAAGKVGQAFIFDGSDDYLSALDVSFPSANNPRTVGLWMKTNATGERYLFSYGPNNSNQRFSLGIKDNHLHVENQGSGWQGDTAVNDDAWHHLTATWNGSAMQLFVDGVEQTLTPLGAPWPISLETTLTGEANIGRLNNITGYDFSGLADEITIFDRVLSATEIAVIAQAGGNGMCYSADSTPDSFTLTAVSGVQPSSNPQTSFAVAGINSAALISITGGQYAIGGCGGPFTSNPGTVRNGDIVCVQVTAAGTAGGTASADLTIGGVTSTFTAATLQYYARVTPGPKNYSASLTDAYAAATLPGEIIEAYDHPFNEDLDCNGDHAVTLNGGYDSAFDQQIGWSTLSKLTVSGTGSVALSHIEVK